MDEMPSSRLLYLKYLLIFLLFAETFILAIVFTYRYQASQALSQTLKSAPAPVQLRKLPSQNMLVYTKYKDPNTSLSSGFIYIAELGDPDSMQKVYNFRTHQTNSQLESIIGVTDRKVFYLLKTPTGQEIGYVDLLTSIKSVVATTKSPTEKIYKPSIVPAENKLFYAVVDGDKTDIFAYELSTKMLVNISKTFPNVHITLDSSSSSAQLIFGQEEVPAAQLRITQRDDITFVDNRPVLLYALNVILVEKP